MRMYCGGGPAHRRNSGRSRPQVLLLARAPGLDVTGLDLQVGKVTGQHSGWRRMPGWKARRSSARASRRGHTLLPGGRRRSSPAFQTGGCGTRRAHLDAVRALFPCGSRANETSSSAAAILGRILIDAAADRGCSLVPIGPGSSPSIFVHHGVHVRLAHDASTAMPWIANGGCGR